MGIRELFEAQQREFVSLKDLLTQMCEAEGVTLQMAASVLHKLLTDSNAAAPLFVVRNVSTISDQISRVQRSNLIARIAYIAVNGDFEPSGFEDMDDVPF